MSNMLKWGRESFLWLAVPCCLVLAGPLCAAEVVQKVKQATLTLAAKKIDQGTLQIGLSDEIILRLTVEGDASLEVKQGSRVIPGPAWQVNYVQTRTPTETDLRWEQVLRIEPMVPGEHKLQFTLLEYRVQEEDWVQVQWQEVPVLVTTRITQPDLSRMQGPPGIEELPERGTGASWIPAVVGGTAAVILLALGVWLLRKRRNAPAPAAPPEQAALKQLEGLQNGLPTSLEESNLFHTQLADILREYLEARFQIPAPRQTSEEYYQKLAQSGHLTEEQLHQFRDLLQRCDLARFAPLHPTPEECLQTLELARSFCHITSKMHSISTEMLPGSVPMPTALRAPTPASSPNTSAINSE
jgi:hypothetical protein